MIELGQPVLKCVDGDDAEDRPGRGVAQQDVYEGDDLQGLAKPHVVRQYTTEALGVVESFQGFNQIVVEESHSSYLVGLDVLAQLGR